MKAGRTDFNCYERVRIINITDEEDKWLNGKEGILTNPFGQFIDGDVGVYLDNTVDCVNGICNLKIGEFEVIE